MEKSLHYNLMAAHTLFQKRFLLCVKQEYPALLPGQPKVIDYLLSHPSSFQREIADGCFIEPATLSPILNKMGEAGLIQRNKNSRNKKTSIVSLTDKGRKIGCKLRELFLDVEKKVCEELSEKELEILLQCLQKIQRKAVVYEASLQ